MAAILWIKFPNWISCTKIDIFFIQISLKSVPEDPINIKFNIGSDDKHDKEMTSHCWSKSWPSLVVLYWYIFTSLALMIQEGSLKVWQCSLQRKLYILCTASAFLGRVDFHLKPWHLSTIGQEMKCHGNWAQWGLIYQPSLSDIKTWITNDIQ